jgi:NAD(P)H-dependent FMN reductase
MPLRVLAITGSLRARSSNTEILRAAAMLAPDEFAVELYAGLGDLPHFNPDLDREGSVLPAPVTHLRARVASADVALISSPEYAHGVPGSLKNALDWLVSGPEMIDKPVALLNTSGRSVHAPAALAEVLRTMSARVIPLNKPVVPLAGRPLVAADILGDAELSGVIMDALRALHTSARSGSTPWGASASMPPSA